MRWTKWRRLCQGTVAAFYLCLPIANALGVQTIAGTLVGLKVGPVDLVEPAAGLSAVLAGGGVSLALILAVVPVVLLGLVFGPVFCSWICPWGLISEGVDSIRRRLFPGRWDAQGWRRLRLPRAVILISLLFLTMLVGMPLAAILAPPRLITALPLEAMHLEIVSPVTGGLLLGFLALEVLGPRRWVCRLLCPAGTVANYLRLPFTARIRFEADACLCPSAPICQDVCGYGIDPRQMGGFDGCTTCLVCVDQCPSAALTIGLFGGSDAQRKLKVEG